MRGYLKSPIAKLKSVLKFFQLNFSLIGSIVVVLTFNICVLSLPTTVHANTLPPAGQTATPSAPLPVTSYQLPTNISPTSPLFTDLILHNTFHSFSCLAIGSSLIGEPCLSYQFTQNAQGAIQTIPILSQTNFSGGTLGTVGSLIGGLYDNRPIKTSEYLASLGKGLGIVKEAQAQVEGSGSEVLSPIITLWQVSRNIAYLIMIIIFVVVGLMIMFRNKINPQTVITAQAALPGLVIGLILITFSYFLASLISDTAFIGTNLVGSFFSAAQGNPDGQNLVEKLNSESVLNIFSKFTGIINFGNTTSALNSIWNDLDIQGEIITPRTVLTALGTMMATQFASPITGIAGPFKGVADAFVAVGTAGAPVQAAGLAITFIAMAILIYAMFRLLLKLVNTYLTIIFLTVTAPFHFLASSLPGRQGLATGWIIQMLGNVLVFPAVLAIFYFVAFLLAPLNKSFELFKVSPPTTSNFIPIVSASGPTGAEIVGNKTFPLFGGMSLEFIQILLAFGALVALPAVPDVIKRSIGAVSQAGQLIGQELGAGTGAGRGYASQASRGIGGMAERAGPLADTKSWNYDGQKWIYSSNPLTGSKAGVISKTKALWPFGKKEP